MNTHVPGSVVTGFESLIDSIHLPDQDDRHVVAAAIHTRAEAIITFNVKDFPEKTLSQYGVVALHPDDFNCDLIDLNVSAIIQAVRRQRNSLKKPPYTAFEFLDLLQKQRLPKSVSLLKPFELMV